jgi:hypothetical protein
VHPEPTGWRTCLPYSVRVAVSIRGYPRTYPSSHSNSVTSAAVLTSLASLLSGCLTVCILHQQPDHMLWVCHVARRITRSESCRVASRLSGLPHGGMSGYQTAHHVGLNKLLTRNVLC